MLAGFSDRIEFLAGRRALAARSFREDALAEALAGPQASAVPARPVMEERYNLFSWRLRESALGPRAAQAFVKA